MLRVWVRAARRRVLVVYDSSGYGYDIASIDAEQME
jgi:hypothetical protein